MEKEEYFLAFFLIGAYQEILGMKHNLFTHPTEATVKFDKNGDYKIDSIREAQSLIDLLDDLDYDISIIKRKLKNNIENQTF